MFRSSREPISFARASAFPQNDAGLWTVCPGNQVKYCFFDFEGLADIEQNWSLYVSRPKKQTDAIPAALSTPSLDLFSLDVIAHA